ncbi:MAG: thioredoxin family protein [Firmicutes bacterium]|nr:thioredoxin family protein [Bacillota bacterium]
MDIKILGPGCQRCQALEKLTFDTLAELDVAADVEKVTDIKQIMGYGVMSTPGLVINGKVKLFGRVPTKGELKELIKEEL